MNSRIALPIDPFVPQIIACLNEAPNLVLKASPGSGKTTRVCPALLDAAFHTSACFQVLVLEPRRLAAKLAARQVAKELGEAVGNTVGYQFRFEKVVSQKTRLIYLTEGMLMRRALFDPLLSKISLVILDEFHERHLQSDLALSYLRRLQQNERPSMRILVMSATLEADSLTEYLGNCKKIELSLPTYPVEIHFLPSAPSRPLDKLVEQAVHQALRSDLHKGHILVFLPGYREIQQCAKTLTPSVHREGMSVEILHGDLPKEIQEKALDSRAARKVILSTNIAESSLTIAGVSTVIDSGLHRQASYSAWSGIPSLKTKTTSKASVTQRTGRAGRTGPGQCFRLFSKADYESRPSFDLPEIRRADLSQSLLELAALGIENTASLPWYETPLESNLTLTKDLLFRIGALDSAKRLTPLGKRLAQLPLHPRLGRVLIEAEKRGVLLKAAALAAALTEGELQKLDALEDDYRTLSPNAAKLRDLYLSNFPQLTEDKNNGEESALAFSILTGFPDRVARKKEGQSGLSRQKLGTVEFLFCLGGSGSCKEDAALREGEYFTILDVRESFSSIQDRAIPIVRSLVRIDPAWLLELDPCLVTEEEKLLWDDRGEKVVKVSQMTYGSLVLLESEQPLSPSMESCRILMKQCLGIELDKAQSLPLKDWIHACTRVDPQQAFESALTRISLALGSGLKSQTLSPHSLAQAMERIVLPFNSRAELLKIDWAGSLASELLGPNGDRLSDLLPSFVSLARGRRCPIHYRFGLTPYIESRIQDFFGLADGPKILKGSLPLILHLLAPNGRAVQVTDDLESFWKSHYPKVRKELSRRYPKHDWPVDPLQGSSNQNKPR